jgi:Disulphide bond corrector protein DsbC
MNIHCGMTFLAITSLASMLAAAQIVSTNQQNRPAIAKTDAVAFLFPEQITVPAGKPDSVALHFRVAQGLHINSHTPSDNYLIGTDFSIPAGAGVRLDSATYPQGTIMALPADPTTKLSVYTGQFIIQARIVAAPGEHLVQAKLHYQACNESQCLPPKTINVPIDVIGK